MKFQNKVIETILNIPLDLPNSNEMLCNIIQIFYELKVEAWVEGCHGNVILNTPIVVGSHPLVIDLSSVQPTYSGQLERPAVSFQPVLPYTDGNNLQNTTYPLNFNNDATPSAYIAPYPPAMTTNDQRKCHQFDKVHSLKFRFQHLRLMKQCQWK